MFINYVLQYMARGFFCFPVEPGGKKPLTQHGFKDGSRDPNQAVAWWRQYPTANIGLATGLSGLVALDPDGPEGVAELRRLIGIHGPLPRTLTARTANGFHLYFRASGIRSTAKGKLHVRGEGGYTILPPSIHPTGVAYAWALDVPPVDAPTWIADWRASLGGGASGFDLGAAPGFLAAEAAVNLPARHVNFSEPWSAHDEVRVRAALKAVPADNYDTWCTVAMALNSLNWDRSDGTNIGLDIFHEWSATCPEKYAHEASEQKFWSFRKSGISVGSLFHLAQKHGWDGRAEYQQNTAIALNNPPETGPFAAANVKPNGHDPTGWVNFDKAGNPTSTCANTRVAIELLGVRCRYDTFHGKYMVSALTAAGGNGAEHPLQVAGELVDQAVHVIRVAITDRWRFDPTAQHVRDACEQIGIANRFDPIVDYLEATEWDRRARIDTWMTQYLGAADAPLTRAVGVLMLRAAVRRVRQPGCKWDYVVVLEGVENTGKSTALSVLAGDENFSDQSILAHNERDQQEAIQGIWIYELAELAGMRRAEVEKVKAFLTRTNDRARPAYGHYREDRPRRCVFVGTTNTDEYLKSETGNRRFWPVRTGRIDIDALRRDRDQLWAEAVAIEDRENGRLELVNGLNEQAAEAQRERLEADPWENPVRAWLGDRETVGADDVLRDCLHMQHREQDRAIRARVGSVLKRLGWEKYRHREGLHLTWRFRPPQ